MVTANMKMIAGAVAVAGIGFYLYGKATGSGSGGFFQTVGSGVGNAAVDVADGIVSGVALNLGDRIGLPRTDKTACELALEDGRTWDASFACPASTFIKSFF